MWALGRWILFTALFVFFIQSGAFNFVTSNIKILIFNANNLFFAYIPMELRVLIMGGIIFLIGYAIKSNLTN